MERDSIDETVPSLDCARLKNLVHNSIEQVVRSSINRTGIVDRRGVRLWNGQVSILEEFI